MRQPAFAFMLVLMLSACSRGDAPAETVPPDGCGADVADSDSLQGIGGRVAYPGTRADEPEPELIDVQDAWLRVEARADDDGFTWHIEGEDGVSSDQVEEALKEYAEKVDNEAGLKGLGDNGISGNPVHLTCNARVSSRAFAAVIEMMAMSRIWRACVELTAPSGIEKREWVELPIDEGLDRDSPGPVMAYLHAMQENKVVRYRIGPSTSRHEAIDGADFKLASLTEEAFDEAVYASVRDALKQKIASIATLEGELLERVEIIPAEAEFTGDTRPFVSWVALFVAIDAGNRVDGTRENVPLKITYRFFDALGRYSNG